MRRASCFLSFIAFLSGNRISEFSFVVFTSDNADRVFIFNSAQPCQNMNGLLKIFVGLGHHVSFFCLINILYFVLVTRSNSKHCREIRGFCCLKEYHYKGQYRRRGVTKQARCEPCPGSGAASGCCIAGGEPGVRTLLWWLASPRRLEPVRDRDKVRSQHELL